MLQVISGQNPRRFTQNKDIELSLAEEQELVVVFPPVDWLTGEQFETALCGSGSPLDSDASHIVFDLPRSSYSKLLIDALACYQQSGRRQWLDLQHVDVHHAEFVLTTELAIVTDSSRAIQASVD